jgi:CRP/FNR family transcriptional regulator, cyclic AMP receptor protein
MNDPNFPLSLFKSFDNYKSVAKGEVIFDQGSPGDVMYLIKSGSVSLVKGETLLETVEANGIFGEMALVDSEPRSARAVAASDCQLIPVDPKWFFFMVEQTPYFARHVMKLMADRLRRVTSAKIPG